MFAVIDSTETESGYDSYVNLNENLASSGMEEGRNGFRTPKRVHTPGGIR
jgi:hypothetical protein